MISEIMYIDILIDGCYNLSPHNETFHLCKQGELMTSKERIRKAVSHENTDKLPIDFIATNYTVERLKKELKLNNEEEVLQYIQSDVRVLDINKAYNGKTLKTYVKDGETYEETFWGYERKHHFDGNDYNLINTKFALDDDMNIDDALDKYTFPNADDFDYSVVSTFTQDHPDKAICFGHAGAYQMAATNLRNTELLLMDMALNPDGCHRLFDGMNNFLLKHYEKALEAGKGKVDILRIHDDYGTQISMLFSIDMWKDYFMDNLKKFADLAHKYDAMLMQHSCGAIEPLLPYFIECGVDILDPIQKVQGLEPKNIKDKYGKDITFHGGIDTQNLLPKGTTDEVQKECEDYIDILYKDGGYIFTSSQHLQGDVPVKNIIAMYETAKKY